MKVKVPREYASLPKKQKDKVCEYMTQIAVEEANRCYNKDVGIILEQFLMMACINLHRIRGCKEEYLRAFLVGLRRIFRENKNYVKKGCQNEKLQAEIEQIFPKYGWPHDMFIDIIGELNPEYKEKCNKEKES
jgi:pyruvate-formate lyase